MAALGTLCTEATAVLLVEAGAVPALHALAVQRGEQDAFALATTLAAQRLLQAGPSREALLQRPELAARFAELLEHPSKEVARAADVALDCIAAISEEWAASARRLRFEAHNRLWIDVIGGAASVAAAAAAAGIGGAAVGAEIVETEAMWVASPSPIFIQSAF